MSYAPSPACFVGENGVLCEVFSPDDPIVNSALGSSWWAAQPCL